MSSNRIADGSGRVADSTGPQRTGAGMTQKETEYDVAILGSGPAGLQAAMHAARSKASVLVLGRVQRSSLYRAHVENYCCLEGTLAGSDILEQGRSQAEKFGAKFIDEDVTDLQSADNGSFRIELESGEMILARGLILAMGVSRNRLNVAGEKEFLGKGVSYCVDCDGNFFRDQTVVVVGEESAACSGALRLLLTAREVHLVYGKLQVNEHLQYHVQRSGVVEHPGCKVESIRGGQGVERVVLDNGESIEATGVFIELGAKGALELATQLGVALDAETMRYVAVTRKQETSRAGVYAAGDICGPPWQMAKAVGEGCVAGLEAAGYARRQKAQG